MRKLLIMLPTNVPEFLTYDQDKDSSSEEAMWILDKILYDLVPGDTLTISCEE